MPESLELPLRLMQLINGFQVTQALHVAVTLRVPDLLADGPRSVDDLARVTATHTPTLYRLLRALSAVRVLEERPDRSFAGTPMSELLRSDRPASFAGWAAYVGRPYHFSAWANLLHSVRTGENAFAALHGESVWEYRAKHPDESEIFDEAMTSISRMQTEVLLASFDFGRFRRIADVGGGRGALLAAILEEHPSVEGILFDQPHVVTGAAEILRGAGVDKRCRVVAGSFFESVPEADAYVLKRILHDWEDEPAAAILRVIRAAAPKHARVLAIEQLVAPPNQGAPAKFMDLAMLVSAGGRERTREEFAALYASAGFTLAAVHPAGPVQVIEGALA